MSQSSAHAGDSCRDRGVYCYSISTNQITRFIDGHEDLDRPTQHRSSFDRTSHGRHRLAPSFSSHALSVLVLVDQPTSACGQSNTWYDGFRFALALRRTLPPSARRSIAIIALRSFFAVRRWMLRPSSSIPSAARRAYACGWEACWWCAETDMGRVACADPLSITLALSRSLALALALIKAPPVTLKRVPALALALVTRLPYLSSV